MSELCIWTIYWNPRDAPNKFVLRRCTIVDGKTSPNTEASHHDTLEEARAALPEGLYNNGRSRHDDPVIVEVWL